MAEKNDVGFTYFIIKDRQSNGIAISTDNQDRELTFTVITVDHCTQTEMMYRFRLQEFIQMLRTIRACSDWYQKEVYPLSEFGGP